MGANVTAGVDTTVVGHWAHAPEIETRQRVTNRLGGSNGDLDIS